MTDTLDTDEPLADFAAMPEGWRKCAKPDCAEVFETTGSPGAHFRRYCDEHAPPKQVKGRRRRPAADKAPPSVTVNLGPKAKGKDKELAAVEDRARQLVELVAALILLSGHAEDAADISRGAPALAKSLAELAEYEAWLRKLAAGDEMTGRAMAWVQVAVALVGMCLPILLRHKALPENIRHLAEGAFQMAATADAATA